MTLIVHGQGGEVVVCGRQVFEQRFAGQSKDKAQAMITGIQDGARAAVAQMDDGVARVEQGGVLANRAGQAIGEIDASTRAVISAVGNISAAISEQSTASHTIARGVEQIARMAEANHSSSQRTEQSAQALRALATRLDEALGRFRVG